MGNVEVISQTLSVLLNIYVRVKMSDMRMYFVSTAAPA